MRPRGGRRRPGAGPASPTSPRTNSVWFCALTQSGRIACWRGGAASSRGRRGRSGPRDDDACGLPRALQLRIVRGQRVVAQDALVDLSAGVEVVETVRCRRLGTPRLAQATWAWCHSTCPAPRPAARPASPRRRRAARRRRPPRGRGRGSAPRLAALRRREGRVQAVARPATPGRARAPAALRWIWRRAGRGNPARRSRPGPGTAVLPRGVRGGLGGARRLAEHGGNRAAAGG